MDNVQESSGLVRSELGLNFSPEDLSALYYYIQNGVRRSEEQKIYISKLSELLLCEAFQRLIEYKGNVSQKGRRYFG